jgi:hypothetical protein
MDLKSGTHEYFQDKICYHLPHFRICLSFCGDFAFGINWSPRLPSAPGLIPPNGVIDSLETYRIDNDSADKNCFDRTLATVY